MIRSFRDKRTANLFTLATAKRLDSKLARQAHESLVLLDSVEHPLDLAAVGGREMKRIRLAADLGETWQFRVRGPYRIRFRWEADGAHDVEFGDFH